jgi:Transposase Tn5 dimerisation domain/Transposase DNA-binding
MTNWAQEELKTLRLGDARLEARAVVLAEQMGQRPGASIPQACGDWGQTQAAYRFLANEDTSGQALLQAHAQASLKRMAAQAVVLCLQDTTELEFDGQSAQGLGRLNYEARRGLYVHPTYAVTPQREPLGLVNAWNWARVAKGQDGQIDEGVRWVESYAHLAGLAEGLGQTRLVCVGDRESDTMALFERGQDRGWAVDVLVRAQHDRVLPGKQAGKLWSKVMGGEALGTVEFEMPAGRGRKARVVQQELRAQRVVLKAAGADKADGPGRPAIEMTCVIASEVNVPVGAKPVIWRLLSNRAVQTLEQAAELVEWYRARWEIELLFLVLKEGCRVERLQIGHIDRLETALAMYLIIAWRINRLMRLGRQLPELPAELFFEDIEWQAAFILNRRKPPKAPPKLNTVVRLIAQLGGFLARKHDGEPGAKTLWLGMREVNTFVRGVRFAKEMGTCV